MTASCCPRTCVVPGILVDCVVLAEPEMHRMNYGVQHDAALAGQIRVPVSGMKKMKLDARKIIARRAAFELPPNGVVNLGVGAPEGISAVANEEKVTPYITLTTEAGAVGRRARVRVELRRGDECRLRHRPGTRCSTSTMAAAST